MTPERWQKAKALFGAALEQSREERASFLDRACAGDPSMRAEIGSLLAAHESDGGVLDRSDRREPDLVEPEPRRIGHYRIVREIGHGGMGTVYLAERVDEYRRQVAIKVIRRGMDSEFVVARFRAERQILAGLLHPNIAALLDGGTTDDGQPYFVMEHVDGQPIDRDCDARQLPVAQRLEVFLAVCGAVAHAHARLVVHRDIKPANILVTRDGVPKLLDFGLAKLIDPGAAAERTATQARMLTPAFASPEQCRGEPITTATDVYSLGVLLYVLLTGKRPFGSGESTYEELMRAVCETEPRRPSAAAGRRVQGELDVIVLKAMRKEPERRYTSAEHLAEDVRRHLDGRPVLARPNTAWYLARKFISRHRAGVAAAAGVVVALAGGVIETTRQRARAERRFNDVRKLANSFLFEVHDAIAPLPGSTRARELVVRRALEYLDHLAAEAGTDRELQGELASAYVRVGDVQGGTKANVGDSAGAKASYEKALRLQRALVAADPADARARRNLALTYNTLGTLLCSEMGEDAAGRAAYESALSLLEGDGRASAQDPADAVFLTNQRASLAWVLADQRLPEALDHARSALAAAERLASESHDSAQALSLLAWTTRTMGHVQERLTPNRGAGLPSFRNAQAIFERLARVDPVDARKRSVMGNLFWEGDALWEAGDPGGALRAYRQGLEITEALAKGDIASLAYQTDLAWLLSRIGRVELHTGEPAAALANLGRGLAILEPIMGPDPLNQPKRVLMTYLHADLGGAHALMARQGGLRETERADHFRLAALHLHKAAESLKAVTARSKFQAYDELVIRELPLRIAESDAILGRIGRGE